MNTREREEICSNLLYEAEVWGLGLESAPYTNHTHTHGCECDCDCLAAVDWNTNTSQRSIELWEEEYV